MRLIVGLGNPGKKYIKTRHNIGFRILDKIRIENNFPDFKLDKKFNALLSKKNGVFLLKPQTFMNKSGISVSNFIRYYNVEPSKLIVIHDDADFKLGKVKIDKNRSSGGHKGVQSVINHLSTKEFWRLRFGIGKEEKKAGDIALEKFSKKEDEKVERLIQKVINEIDRGLEKGFTKKGLSI